ncbi:metallophosphoesterase [uncultured Desulfobacter sp.]|uniref:metallophosphoesterase family protein n=1 Tax=uncultured Desulfobacter sp. TaxID=240139 RepID=UPI0029F56917|nr:metallophosphoesterase [uncultured Desulfobacter sp.]
MCCNSEHWGKNEHDIFWPRIEQALFNDFDRLCELTGQKGWDAIFFTGDISNTGTAEQFTTAGKKIDRLVDKLLEYGKSPDIFFVPGNHDLKRIINPGCSEEKQLQRNIHDLATSWFNDDKSPFTDFFNAPDQCFYMKAVETVFLEYTQFIKQRINPGLSINPGLLPGDFSATLGNNDLKIGLVGLNSSFLHLESGDFQGKLDLDMRQLLRCVNHPTVEINDWFGKHDIAILLTHHPRSWLNTTNCDTHNQIFAPGLFGLHLYGHAHTQEYQDIFLQGETKNLKKIQSSALFSREEYEIYENGQLTGRFPRIHGYSAGTLYKEGQEVCFRLWPRSIEITNSGSQFFERARGFFPCREKNDEGTAPATVTCCRKQGSSIDPPAPDPIPEYRETKLNSIQTRVCMEIATCLEDSGIEDFNKQIQKQISRKWGKSVETAFDIGKAMVSFLPGQTKPALNKIIPVLIRARDEAIKAKINTGAIDVGHYIEEVRRLTDKVFGWLIHLTISPDWLEKNLLDLKNSSSAVEIDAKTALGAGIIAARVNEEPAIFERNGNRAGRRAENFNVRGACSLPGSEGLGADFKNVVQKIKQHLYCQLASNTPDYDPENLPFYETDSENLELRTYIEMRKEMGWNVFVPFNKKDKSHPFQDPRVIKLLKTDLKILDIFVHNYSDTAGALLFNEFAEIQVWLNLYNENKPDT